MQPYVLHSLEVGGDEPHLATFAVEVLEGVAELGIQIIKIFDLDAFAVRWIGDYQRPSFWWFLILERAVIEHHVLVQLGVLKVLLRLFQNAHINIVAPYLAVEVARPYLAVFLLLDALPLGNVELTPTFEGKVLMTIVLGRWCRRAWYTDY